MQNRDIRSSPMGFKVLHTPKKGKTKQDLLVTIILLVTGMLMCSIVYHIQPILVCWFTESWLVFNSLTRSLTKSASGWRHDPRWKFHLTIHRSPQN